jgi:hypothetical protein
VHEQFGDRTTVTVQFPFLSTYQKTIQSAKLVNILEEEEEGDED